MKLYHGTSAANLPSMQECGIAPRAITKAKDNWKHTVSSNKDAVYLTDAYPWHFAACATEQTGCILEIDRDLLLPWLLCPDEDFMEQASRNQSPTPEAPGLAPKEWDMKKRTRYYRKIARHNASLADKSLEHMGTAAYYGNIPWRAVSRHVVIEWKELTPEMLLRANDSMVSIINYRILAERHRAFVRWFFNDPVQVDELLGIGKVQGVDSELLEVWNKQREAMIRIMDNRSGLTIVDNSKQEVTELV